MVGYEYVHGPRDGEQTDEVGALDVAEGPTGTYTVTDRPVVGRAGFTRTGVEWTPAAGGRRNPPRCAEPCCAGCPAAGLAGA